MLTTVIPKPSSLISQIQLEKVNQYVLFKFTNDLQNRLEELLDKKKADLLTSEELIELESIGELDRIFTHINAMLIAEI